MAAITPSSVNPPPETLVAEWRTETKHVCLFQRPTCFAFSTEGPTGKKTTFRPAWCSSECAINLVNMFFDTIGVNLEKEPVHSSCFLPRISLPLHGTKQQAAFFCFIDAGVHVEGDVKWARCGIFDPQTQARQTFEIDDAVTKQFLIKVPNTNRDEQDQLHPETGQPIKGTARPYKMTAHLRRLSARFIGDGPNKSPSLQRVSVFDCNVTLSRDQWAVTVISMPGSTCGLLHVSTGHAQLACEGIDDNNEQFLTYAHVNKFRINGTNMPDGRARVETIQVENNQHPRDSLNGPTWRIKSVALARIMEDIKLRETTQELVDFSPAPEVLAKYWTQVKRWVVLSVIPLHGLMPEDPLRVHPPRNCWAWCQRMLLNMGIRVVCPVTLFRPNEIVHYLRENPHAVEH